MTPRAVLVGDAAPEVRAALMLLAEDVAAHAGRAYDSSNDQDNETSNLGERARGIVGRCDPLRQRGELDRSELLPRACGREAGAMRPRPWLWPDRPIRKAESRVLREEHNSAVNMLHGPVLNYLDEMAAHADTPVRREEAKKLRAAIRGEGVQE